MLLLVALASGRSLHAQEQMVELNFPAGVSVEDLVTTVSDQLGVRILYDASVASKRVTIRAPGKVPSRSLTSVLQSALRMSDLALVDAGIDGWLKIVAIDKLPRNAKSGDAEQAMKLLGGDTPITQSFHLKHLDPTAFQSTISLFLTAPSGTGGRGGNSVVVADQRVLIVTDYASNVARIAKLIQLVDRPKPDVLTRFVKAKNVDAQTLSEKLGEVLAARQKAKQTDTAQAGGVEVTFDKRTNNVIIIGEAVLVEQVEEFLKVLDVPQDVYSEVYSPVALQTSRLDKLIRDLLELDEGQNLYRAAVDEEENLLVVSATKAIHGRIADLVKRLDRPTDQSRSPVRFYKLVYATADDVLETIRAMTGSTERQTDQINQNQRNGRFNTRDDGAVPGPNRPSRTPQQPLEDRPRPPNSPASDRLPDERTGTSQEGFGPGRDANLLQLATDDGFDLDFAQGRARVTADNNTNTLIVVGPANVQAIYARLIKQLDKPRPQVLIEAKVVVIDTSDNFALGVELSGGDRLGARQLFAFSSFGLSDIDPTNGALSILPGVGFNGTLIDPQVADVVLRALSTHRRAKVISSPRILVNDNATGRLSSVLEVPFTSVNASQTVATTSFAGFAEAGTTVEVTPHISEGDQLQLEYRLTLNEFQPGGGGDVPPPRQTDEIESEVTIPDGYTIIVGGLNRTGHAVTTDSIPFLERIPILKHAVTNRTNQFTSSAVFIFLKPIILRDDKFRDLKYFSERDVFRAYIPGDYPVSQPLLIR
jgi:general secretion pathway protein D